MRILKQTYQELVLCHRQTGRWLVAGGWLLLLCLGAIVGFSFKPEIVCPGGTQTPSCRLTYRSFTGLALERDIQLKAARSESICGFSRTQKSSCNGFTVILTTDAGDISFPDDYLRFQKKRANQFIQNPSKTSFQIQSGVLPVIDRPFLFVLGCMVIAVILRAVDTSLAKEEIYTVRFNKTKDWATVTCRQRSGKPPIAVTEFPISAIASVNVGRDYLALTLKSGREVRLAAAIWGKKTMIEPIGESPVEVNQAFNETQKEISAFLQN
ncbi:hypothetical protein [Trichocoleus sp. FACHB-262]|uniref:hypothetical protein n=1 Tax=Trichocoleus sp. FACHB-262 TaxID=2692869 RepID=UPI0016841DD9|nr:hypothetical protein [Trichocoleus sp. FACHB-262]MBD2120549.1 hypothetical protein [Trichocoleus sp. FACHB-262]